jgi:HEPN domain-containing protein
VGVSTLVRALAEQGAANKMEHDMSADFAEVIREQLPIIDEYLAAIDVELLMRPFHAASLFVEKCVVSVEGDTKDKYLDKPWFKDIYQEIKKWYVVRYGERLRSTRPAAATGLVPLFRTLFCLEVPLVTQELVDGGLRKWISFPDAVLPEETPLSWLKPPPNLAGLSNDDYRVLEVDARWVAGAIRECSRDMLMAEAPTAVIRRLAQSIPTHLSKGADYALDKQDGRNLAIWEFHLAVEKSFKVFLSQQSLRIPHTHDLWELCGVAENHGLSGIDRKLLEIMPRHREAIEHRYGELNAVSGVRAHEIYRAALSLSACCGRRLRRNLRTRNMRFLIRKLPWEQTAELKG